MSNHKLSSEKIKIALSVLFAATLGAMTTVFTVLLFLEYRGDVGFWGKHAVLFAWLGGILGGILTACTVGFRFYKKQFIYKLLIAVSFVFAIVVILFYSLKSSGFLDKIGSAEGLQQYVSEKGKWAPYLFVAIQFFQVSVLPIPGAITIIAGVALFGPLKASLLSLIGIMIGSVVSFAIGKTLGYKVSVWFVGEETLNKWLSAIKGKDKMLLTFMFLLPFFPDDILCIVAGLSTMGWAYFIGMNVVCRTISVFTTAYFGSGLIIPYNTWWGLLLWGLIIIAVAVIMYLLYKKGDKIEKWFLDKFKRKKQGDRGQKVRSQNKNTNN